MPVKKQGPKKHYTSKDVAAKAGVSQSTVSRVFSPSANVSEKKRKKILEIARQLNYQPNAIARGLSTRKTQLIGIVVRDFRNPFYPAVVSKFYQYLAQKGYHLLFINTEHEHIGEKEINQLIDYHVDGVIITDVLLTSTEAERFARHDISIVLFNRYTTKHIADRVYCDNIHAGRQIASYLLSMGHRSFAFISGPDNTSTSSDRKKGFESVIKQNKGSSLLSFPGTYSYEHGFEAAQEILSSNKKPEAVFCANDILAIGAMEGIRQMGYSIPDDISVIGFDDIEMASWPAYQLTTWAQPVDELVRNSVDLLLKKINGETTEPEEVVLKGKLIVRQTAGKRK